MIGVPIPRWLQEPIVVSAEQPPVRQAPRGLTSPHLAAEPTAPADWSLAGYVEPELSGGAMQRSASHFRRLWYGFDRQNLYFRLELTSDLPAGSKVAIYLSGKGLKVSIVEGERRLGRDVNPFYLWRYLQVLKGRGAEILTQHEALRFEDRRLVCSFPKGERTLEADLFVMAVREDRWTELETWRRWAPEVLLVGDARRPRRLHNAVHEAYRLARGL